MSQPKKNIDLLFQRVKSSNTELSKKQVEAFIYQLPNLPEPKSKHNFKQYLNFKNITMISIPSVFAIIYLSTHISTSETNLNTRNISLKNISFSEIQIEEKSSVLNPVDGGNEDEAQSKPSKSTSSSSLLNKETNLVITPLESNDQAQSSIKQENKLITSQDKTTNNHSDPFVILSPSNYTDQYLKPKAARKLKKILYKNLFEDRLIQSKISDVEMELRRESIILNGKQMTNDMLQKYKDLTQEAGFGPNRKIILTSDYIRVGDFTEEGFRGIGFGKFQNEPAKIDRNSSSLQTSKENVKINSSISKEEELDLLIDLEISELDKFVNNLYKDKAVGSKRSWFKASRKLDRDLGLIHSKLYDLLLNDQLISDKNEFVVLELKENEILFNGKVLNSSTSSLIISLIKEYKINRKTNRLIKMSRYSIAVVDYQFNSFTGTFLEIR